MPLFFNSQELICLKTIREYGIRQVVTGNISILSGALDNYTLLNNFIQNTENILFKTPNYNHLTPQIYRAIQPHLGTLSLEIYLLKTIAYNPIKPIGIS